MFTELSPAKIYTIGIKVQQTAAFIAMLLSKVINKVISKRNNIGDISDKNGVHICWTIKPIPVDSSVRAEAIKKIVLNIMMMSHAIPFENNVAKSKTGLFPMRKDIAITIKPNVSPLVSNFAKKLAKQLAAGSKFEPTSNMIKEKNNTIAYFCANVSGVFS